MWASLVVAALLALVLALFAKPLLGFIYGDSFRDASKQLLLLLPGAVLFAGSAIVGAGVFAAGRPFTATVAQLIGMVVTVVGLFVFLRSGGITAAALVSTASYSSVFAAMVIAYKHVTGMRWAEFVPSPARLRALAA
jgi:O-antigen/teichoic acid export membrane protein